jgi:hypothetical protein
LESLLSVWCNPCPPWSQVACKLTSPSPFPPHSLFPPPTVPQFNYAPFYDNITTPTSLSLAQFNRAFPEDGPLGVLKISYLLFMF